MIHPQPPNLPHLDPTKLDFDLDIRHLSRQMIFTVTVLDDKLFSDLSKEIESIYVEAKAEFAKMKQDLKNQKP